MSGTTEGRTLTVRQVRSGIGFDRRQKATLKALGLGRPGHVRRHPDNPQVRGMIGAVRHLVRVEEDAAGGSSR
jgi:large subunit ribosomal protein L30